MKKRRKMALLYITCKIVPHR